jgi:serine/threonine protein kinase
MGMPPTAATVAAPPTASTLSSPSPSTAATESLHTDEASRVADEKQQPPEVSAAAGNPKNRFGKYILVKQIGHGGMAVVYKAWDTFLNQYVALKFIKAQDISEGPGEADKEQLDAFMVEARLAVRLNHPNIARVYELGRQDDRLYMSQYYIEGPTLHELIHGTKSKSYDTHFYSDPGRFTRIMRDLAEAMAYAHSLTPPIIHRDLKPSNVLLDQDGKAYVVDFGLAKELKVDSASMSGAVRGTPKYMAPEQAEGRSRDMDARTDIWALGVILFEMLTGRAPFEDENIHRLLSKIVNEDPPWPRHVVSTSRTAQLNPSTKGALTIPRDLEVIAMKCLQKDKRHRYASAKALSEDLSRTLQGQAVSVPDHSLYWFAGRMARLVRRHRFTLIPAVLAVLAAGVFLTVGWVRPRLALRDLVAQGDAALRDHRLRDLPAIQESIARIDPLHPKLAEYRAALEDAGTIPAARRAEIDRVRDAFLAQPSEESLAKLVGTMTNLEPVLVPVLRQGLPEWWTGFLSAREVEARAIYGNGTPSRDWLSEEIRGRARALQKDLELADRVKARRDVLGLRDADLARSFETCRAILDWKGRFSLAANVRPWAAVRVRVGGKDLSRDASHQDDLTPLRYDDLPVGDVRLDFAHGGTVRTLEIPTASLKDGAVIRVWGSLDHLEHAIE